MKNVGQRQSWEVIFSGSLPLWADLGGTPLNFLWWIFKSIDGYESERENLVEKLGSTTKQRTNKIKVESVPLQTLNFKMRF